MRASRTSLVSFILLLIFGAASGWCSELKPERGRGGERNTLVLFLTDTPSYPGNVVLGRPTSSSVTFNILWQQNTKLELVWGVDQNRLPKTGRTLVLKAGEPGQVELDGLTPDTRYAYALLDATSGKRLLPADKPGSFHTARFPGRPFTFTIQADSHLDGSCLPELYQRTLEHVLADNPDFHIDLGDTFMTEKHQSRASAFQQYAAQRHYFGLVGHSVPIFLALGNHDGERLDKNGTVQPDSLAVWARETRRRFFPNPQPNVFYQGNATPHPLAGPLENYFAWEWGDALFVVLDPYWSSLPTKGGSVPWNMTIGSEQYHWLERTLKNSTAPFKFVFIHQLTGSYHESGRGGAEAARYQEWGGLDVDGRDVFYQYRPGWRVPIHQLLAEQGVAAVFHGHDHFYARQELDGVLYQLVPQPAHRNQRRHQADEYGYKDGLFLPNSGYLRILVHPEKVIIEYIGSESDKNRLVKDNFVLEQKAKAIKIAPVIY